MKNVAPVQVARGQDGIRQRTNGAPPARHGSNKAFALNVCEHLCSGVRGAGAEARNFHRGEIVDVVTKETGALERDSATGDKFPQRGRLIACTLRDERDMHLLRIAIHQGRRFTGDKCHFDIETSKQRDAHDVYEREVFRLLTRRRPGKRAIRQNAIDIEGDSLQVN